MMILNILAEFEAVFKELSDEMNLGPNGPGIILVVMSALLVLVLAFSITVVIRMHKKDKEKFRKSLGAPVNYDEILPSLIPLRLNKDDLNTFSLNEQVLTKGDIKKEEIIDRNGIVTIIVKFRKFYEIEISLYETGALIKHDEAYFFTKFKNVKVDKSHRWVNVDKHVTNAKSLGNLLDRDYFYEYHTDTNYTLADYQSDTRHYTKSGKLDKRYSKQNEQTGYAKYKSSTSTTENLYKAEYSFELDFGCFVITLHDNLNKVFDLYRVLCERNNIKPVPREELLKIERVPDKTVKFLSATDKVEIQKLLDSDMPDPEKDQKAVELFNKIKLDRR